MFILIMVLLFLLCWYGGWIFTWVKGTQNQDKTLVFFGAFFTLFILGIIIALIQTTNWKLDNSNDMQAKILEIQRQKIEIEKLAIEREKNAQKKEKKSKDK